eukprot:747818-Hanusia_phi.AAC.3
MLPIIMLLTNLNLPPNSSTIEGLPKHSHMLNDFALHVPRAVGQTGDAQTCCSCLPKLCPDLTVDPCGITRVDETGAGKMPVEDGARERRAGGPFTTDSASHALQPKGTVQALSCEGGDITASKTRGRKRMSSVALHIDRLSVHGVLQVVVLRMAEVERRTRQWGAGQRAGHRCQLHLVSFRKRTSQRLALDATEDRGRLEHKPLRARYRNGGEERDRSRNPLHVFHPQSCEIRERA